MSLVLLNIRMSKKTLKLCNIRLNKKELHKSKQTIDLMSVNTEQIVTSDKFKHSDEGFKYLTGYKEGEIVKPLCIILPEMFWKRWKKTCLSWLKMTMCWINTIKLGTRLKKSEALNFIACLFMIKHK